MSNPKLSAAQHRILMEIAEHTWKPLCYHAGPVERLRLYGLVEFTWMGDAGNGRLLPCLLQLTQAGRLLADSIRKRK